ncbi:MAG: acetoacetate decarboxylase family protein [Acidimicrobiia bacterium]|nr:acetoacetate decarboxylase family protein [Acidimicrobiia bacterium]
MSALAVDVAVRPEVAAGLLPEELELDAQPAATLVVAALPASNAGPAYRETALIYRVISGGLPRRYCAWSVVDNFAAVVLGAELFGFPGGWVAYLSTSVTTAWRRRTGARARRC